MADRRPLKITEHTSYKWREKAMPLIVQLPTCRTKEEVLELIRLLIDKHGFKTRPIGGNERNGIITFQAGDQCALLAEHPINGLHACVELRALEAQQRGEGMPRTLREAVERWFNVPGGRSTAPDVTDVLLRRQDGLPHLSVTFAPGPKPSMPSVLVRDHGIGMIPAQMPDTIFSIHEGVKEGKPYLGQCFNHGGTMAWRASQLGVVVTRPDPLLLEGSGHHDEVGITVVTRNTSTPWGCFEYLVGPDGDVFTAPPEAVREWDVDQIVFNMTRDPMRHPEWLPSQKPTHKIQRTFAPGTLIIHHGFNVGDYHRPLHARRDGRSIAKLMDSLLADMPLPYRLNDLRPSQFAKLKRSTYKGARSVVMRGVTGLLDRRLAMQAEGAKTEEDERLFHVNLRASFSSPHLDGTESVRVKVYVLTGKQAHCHQDIAEDWNVLFTYGGVGQVVHHEKATFFTDRYRVRLSNLYSRLVVYVDLDTLSTDALMQLVMANRHGLQKGPVCDALFQAVKKTLGADASLRRLNDQFQRIGTQKASRSSKDYTSALAAKHRALGTRRTFVPLTEGVQPRRHRKPLPTDVNGPTFLEIESKLPIKIRPGGRARINVASNAPDGYQNPLLIKDREELLVDGEHPQESFYQGHASITVKARNLKPGKKGIIELRIGTKGGGGVIDVDVPFLFTDRKPTGNKGKNTQTTKEENSFGFGFDLDGVNEEMFPDFANQGWTPSTVGEVRPGSGKTLIYINKCNSRLRAYLNASIDSDREKNKKTQAFHDAVVDLGYFAMDYYNVEGNAAIPQAAWDAALSLWLSARNIKPTRTLTDFDDAALAASDDGDNGNDAPAVAVDENTAGAKDTPDDPR